MWVEGANVTVKLMSSTISRMRSDSTLGARYGSSGKISAANKPEHEH